MIEKYPTPKDMHLWEEYQKNLLADNYRRPHRQRPEAYPTILDLHGFTLDEGYNILQTFLARNFAQNSKMVLIITGNNPNGQSFKNKVPRWLQEQAFAPYVAEINTAPPNQGGEGALIIHLKKNK